jgi:hypothetical protein
MFNAREITLHKSSRFAANTLFPGDFRQMPEPGPGNNVDRATCRRTPAARDADTPTAILRRHEHPAETRTP